MCTFAVEKVVDFSPLALACSCSNKTAMKNMPGRGYHLPGTGIFMHNAQMNIKCTHIKWPFRSKNSKNSFAHAEYVPEKRGSLGTKLVNNVPN